MLDTRDCTISGLILPRHRHLTIPHCFSINTTTHSCFQKKRMKEKLFYFLCPSFEKKVKPSSRFLMKGFIKMKNVILLSAFQNLIWKVANRFCSTYQIVGVDKLFCKPSQLNIFAHLSHLEFVSSGPVLFLFSSSTHTSPFCLPQLGSEPPRIESCSHNQLTIQFSQWIMRMSAASFYPRSRTSTICLAVLY